MIKNREGPVTVDVATSRALSEDKDFQPSAGKFAGRSRRFQVDREAFEHRFHDAGVQSKYLPADPQQQLVFQALEEERFLSQGYRRFPGVYGHLPRAKALPDELKGIIRFLRGRWSHKKVKPLALSDNLRPLVESLVDAQSDQEAYAHCLIELLQALVPAGEATEEVETFDPPSAPSEGTQEGESSRSSTPAPSRGQVRAKRRKFQEEESVPAAPSTTQGGSDPELGDGEDAYHPYTRRFDRVVRAEALVTLEERKALKETFLEALEDSERTHTHRLMAKLRTVLQSQSQRKPQFDQEEGRLHHARLSRLVTSQHPLVYQNVEESPYLETTVSLLIDNSGSMRGRPIRLAAVSAYLLAETLNKCNVPVEVLGFTTALWNGGKSRNLWLESGKPPSPGRLNDLLHVVYKDCDTSWRKGKEQFSVMLKEGLLKENIDGEALLWAYHRLQRRNEPRKILIVISDGAPVDDATLAINPGDYLENHLLSTIQRVLAFGDVELLAIGIGHDVGQYYPQSATLESAEQLGPILFEEIIKMVGA